MEPLRTSAVELFAELPSPYLQPGKSHTESAKSSKTMGFSNFFAPKRGPQDESNKPFAPPPRERKILFSRKTTASNAQKPRGKLCAKFVEVAGRMKRHMTRSYYGLVRSLDVTATTSWETDQEARHAWMREEHARQEVEEIWGEPTTPNHAVAQENRALNRLVGKECRTLFSDRAFDSSGSTKGDRYDRLTKAGVESNTLSEGSGSSSSGTYVDRKTFCFAASDSYYFFRQSDCIAYTSKLSKEASGESEDDTSFMSARSHLDNINDHGAPNEDVEAFDDADSFESAQSNQDDAASFESAPLHVDDESGLWRGNQGICEEHPALAYSVNPFSLWECMTGTASSKDSTRLMTRDW